jgi:cytochrome c556
MKRPFLLASAVVAMAGLVHVEASGHAGATGVVKERMDLMKSIGDATKSLAEIMKGSVPYDVAQVRKLASTIEGHSGEAMTVKFPENTLAHPSEAVPAIWSDWDRFSELADQLAVYAGALGKAAGNPRAATGAAPMGGMMATGGPSVEHLASMPPDAAFMQLTQTCSACHQDFRKKKE